MIAYLGLRLKSPEPVGEHLVYALLSRFPPSRLVSGADANVISVAAMLLPDSVWHFYQKMMI